MFQCCRYPQSLHDQHNDYPRAPEHAVPCESMLSNVQLDMRKKLARVEWNRQNPEKPQLTEKDEIKVSRYKNTIFCTL